MTTTGPASSQPRPRRRFGTWLPVRNIEHIAEQTRVRVRYDTGALAGTVVIGHLLRTPCRALGKVFLTGDETTHAVLPWPDHIDRWASPDDPAW